MLKKYPNLTISPAGRELLRISCSICGAKSRPLWGADFDKALAKFAREHRGRHERKRNDE